MRPTSVETGTPHFVRIFARDTILTTAVLLVVATWLAAPCSTLAETRTWTGNSSISGAWNLTANWSAGAYPVNGDDVVFPLTASRRVNTNVFTKLRLNSITFSGAGYDVRGNAIILSDGLDSTAAGSVNTIELNIDLGASQTFDCSSSTAALYLNADVDLGSHTLTMMGPGAVRITGVISGTGGLTKTGTGTHWLQGPTDNTFTGPTLVGQGTLMLAKPNGDSVKYGSLTVGNGVGSADTAIVRELGDYQIGSIPVTINSDGWLDVDDYYDTVGSITFNGGRASSSAFGTLVLGGDVTVSARYSRIEGSLSLGSSTRTFDVPWIGDLIGIAHSHFYLNANVSGSGGLLKTGNGIMQLSGDNTYSGITTVEEGTLRVRSDTALGSAAEGTVVEPDGHALLSAELGLSVHVQHEPLSIAGQLWSGYSYTANTNAWSGPVTLIGTATIRAPSTDDMFSLTGAVSGSGGFTKEGEGTLILSGTEANTFVGDAIVNEGTLQLDKIPADGALPGPGDLYVGDTSGPDNEAVVRWARSVQVDEDVAIHVLPTGHADLDDHSDSIGDVFLNSAVLGTGSGTMTLAGDVAATVSTNRAPTLSGNASLAAGVHTFLVTNTHPISSSLLVSAKVSGPGDLRKTGHGRLALVNSNSYAGTTTVAEGRLSVWEDHALGSTAGGTVVEDGGRLQLGWVDVVEEPLTLHGVGYGHGALAHGTTLSSNSWAGPITLATDVLISVPHDVGNLTTLTGMISGPGSLTKTGEGMLALTGPGNNSYEGDTFVEEGQLLLGKGGLIGSIPQSLFIGGNDPGDPPAVARHLTTTEIHEDVTVYASGTYDLDGHNEGLLNLHLFGGVDVDTEGGLLSIRNDVTVDTLGIGGASSTLSGRLHFPTGAGDFRIAPGGPWGVNVSELVVDAVISGSEEIGKEGLGELQLNAANTFSGSFTISEGGVRLNHDQGLGGTAAGVRVNGNGYLQLHGGDRHVLGEPLTLDSTQSSFGALYAALGTNSWTGDVYLLSDTHIGIGPTDGHLNLAGSIGGGRDITKFWPGTLVLSGSTANTYSGDTIVQEGTLVLSKTIANSACAGDLYIGDGPGSADSDVVRLENGSQIPGSTRITMADSGLFDLNGISEYFGSLAGSGHVAMGSGALKTGSDGSSTVFSGLIEGSGDLEKHGAGTFELSGNNTYSGDTVIHGGALLVNGSQAGSDVLVSNLGTLGGSGTVGNIVSGGTVAPGNSAGQLGCGKTVLQAGSTFDVELDGYTPLDYDRLDVNGSTSIDNADLKVAWGFVPAAGDVFTIVDNHGPDPVFGTFNGLPDGAALTADNVVLKITYSGGDGNDVVLAATKVAPLEKLRFRAFDCACGAGLLQWEGGVPFYQVNKKVDLGTNTLWQPVGPPTRDFQIGVPMDTDEGYYQVIGGR